MFKKIIFIILIFIVLQNINASESDKDSSGNKLKAFSEKHAILYVWLLQKKT